MTLRDKLDKGEFTVLAEIDPPKGADVTRMVTAASRVKGDVDAFVIPEMSNAVMRMSALGGAMILQDKGMETVMQICCRDRNRIALQADLLAAYGCSVTNIMAVKGEDPSFGDHHQARAVNDIGLVELLEVVQKLQTGKDMAGIDLAGAPSFFTGSTVNAGATSQALELELQDMDVKLSRGAQFFITPPVFDASAIHPFMDRIHSKASHIIPTVLLLKSVGMARYIHRNVDHVHVPEDLIKRLQSSADKVNECVAIAADVILSLKAEGFSGVVISTIGWENRLPEILDRL